MAKKQDSNSNISRANPRNKWLFPLLLLLGFAIIYPSIFDKKVNLGGDNAGYYILGKALANGQGYTNIHLPENTPHNHFPPGYPAILGIFMVFSSSITFLKWINGLFLLGTTLLSYQLFERFTNNRLFAFVSALLILFNFHMLSYGTIMMSEVPFLFFSTLAMLLFVRMQKNEKKWYKDPNFYALIFISSFAYHIRTAGIALVAGIALYMLLSKNWKPLLGYLGGFILLGIPWFLRGQNLGGSSYLTQLFLKNPYRKELGQMELSDWFTRLGNNALRYLGKEIPTGIFPSIEVDYTPDAAGHVVYGILILGFIILGLIKLPKYRLLVTGYLLGTFGILLLWPDVWFGIRFMLPLIPIMLFLFLFGIYFSANFVLKKIALKNDLNPLILLVFVLAFIPQIKILAEKAHEPYIDKFKNYFEIAAWANKNTPKDAVICTRKPGLFYLFSGRKVAQFADTADYNSLFADFDQKGFSYVVVDQLGYAQVGRYLVPAVQDNPEKFELLKQIPGPDTYFLRYKPEFGYSGEWRVEEKDGYFTHIREGKGKLVYPDGRIFEGEFKDNLPNGAGTLTLPGGQKQIGIWKDGIYTEQNEQL